SEKFAFHAAMRHSGSCDQQLHLFHFRQPVPPRVWDRAAPDQIHLSIFYTDLQSVQNDFWFLDSLPDVQADVGPFAGQLELCVALRVEVQEAHQLSAGKERKDEISGRAIEKTEIHRW